MCEHEITYNNLMLAYISLWANTGLCHNLTFGPLVSSYRSLFSAGCFTPAVGPSLWLVRWGWWWVERKRTFVARAFAVGSIWEIDDWCASGAQSNQSNWVALTFSLICSYVNAQTSSRIHQHIVSRCVSKVLAAVPVPASLVARCTVFGNRL